MAHQHAIEIAPHPIASLVVEACYNLQMVHSIGYNWDLHPSFVVEAYGSQQLVHPIIIGCPKVGELWECCWKVHQILQCFDRYFEVIEKFYLYVEALQDSSHLQG